jgi:hypothetical protein
LPKVCNLANLRRARFNINLGTSLLASTLTFNQRSRFLFTSSAALPATKDLSLSCVILFRFLTGFKLKVKVGATKIMGSTISNAFQFTSVLVPENSTALPAFAQVKQSGYSPMVSMQSTNTCESLH